METNAMRHGNDGLTIHIDEGFNLATGKAITTIEICKTRMKNGRRLKPERLANLIQKEETTVGEEIDMWLQADADEWDRAVAEARG